MYNRLNIAIFFILIFTAIYFDLTQKRIPNFLTFPVILWGLVSSLIFTGLSGFKASILGFILGLLVFIIPFALGGMGAGDVKMMAAIGSIMGWRFTFYTTIATGLVGGVIVIIYLIYKKKFLFTLKRILGLILKPILFALNVAFNSQRLREIEDYFLNLDAIGEKHYIPYGLAIGLGALIVYFS